MEKRQWMQDCLATVRFVAIVAGQLAVVALWMFIFYAYMLLTPDQTGAECEHEYYLMGQEAENK